MEASDELVERVARALCCGDACVRPDDCWAIKPGRYDERKRARAALAAIPDARDDALDEAAKAAHDIAGQFLSAEGRSNFILHGPGGMAMAMVAAIRSLKAHPAPLPSHHRHHLARGGGEEMTRPSIERGEANTSSLLPQHDERREE